MISRAAWFRAEGRARGRGRSRALVLVSPGNPTGATVPPERLADLAALARRHEIALVLDETYRRDDGGAARRFEPCSAGGFFGWVRHPFATRSTRDVVRDLAIRAHVLVLPGTAFLPDDRRLLRVSISFLDRTACADLAGRLSLVGSGGDAEGDGDGDGQ